MNHFVFVVCGNRKHTDKLNFSLEFLKKFSNANIHVISDLSRNEAPIAHDKVIDVKTPENLSDQEASIYLKTTVHHHLKMEQDDKYCYLDSDVIAVSDEVDKIFQFEPDPVLFATDNCVFSEFSPYAMNCGCLKKEQEKTTIFRIIEDNLPLPVFFPEKMKKTERERNKLNYHFTKIKENKFRYFFTALIYFLKRYILPVKSVSFFGFSFNRKNRCWYDTRGEIIDFDYSYYYKLLKKRYGLMYNTISQHWQNADGIDIIPDTPKCTHLSQHLYQKYGVKIPGNWQHWNGGVFLFNHQASEFMDYWHRLAIQGFGDKITKIRDQGMLAVTVWKFGLQNNKTLPKEYNFIAEYDHTSFDWKTNMVLAKNHCNHLIKPVFIHIYHHWGDTLWSIWQYVCHTGKKLGILK